MALLFDILYRKKSSSNYFWIANAMDHRIYVEIKPIDEIGVKQVVSDTGVEFKPVVKAPAEIGDIGAAANINHNKTEKYEAKQHNTLYFEVCCMTAKRISYKKGKMVYIYRGKVTFSSNTTKGEQLMSWIPKKGYALLIKNNSGDWYDETKMEGECNAINAFQYKDSIGNIKSAFNNFNQIRGREGHSLRNDVEKKKFYVANAFTKPIFILGNLGKLRIEAEDVKMIELSIYRFMYESSLELELLEEIQDNTADAIAAKETPSYKTLARTSYPPNEYSLIVTKDGCVTKSRKYIKDENDDNAWIDAEGKDYNPANNNIDI